MEDEPPLRDAACKIRADPGPPGDYGQVWNAAVSVTAGAGGPG